MCSVVWIQTFVPRVSIPSTNVSCDGTGLPARSSSWTPVTSPTRNPICGHTTLEFGVCRVNFRGWRVGGDDSVSQDGTPGCEVRIDWRARP